MNSMSSKEDKINGQSGKSVAVPKTIDLQGVAAFVGLCELIAQELGTSPGRIQGLLPNGTSFEELVGEITTQSQGFVRTVTLYAKPGEPLKMHFTCGWRGAHGLDSGEGDISRIEANFSLDSAVEQIVPQGRAMARHVEDCFALMDRMVTLGQSGRLSSMSISASELEAFEQSEGSNLVRNSFGRTEAQ